MTTHALKSALTLAGFTEISVVSCTPLDTETLESWVKGPWSIGESCLFFYSFFFFFFFFCFSSSSSSSSAFIVIFLS
jgi:hypothetical protein